VPFHIGTYLQNLTEGDNVFNATYWPKPIQTYEKAARIVDECRDKDGATNENTNPKKTIYPLKHSTSVNYKKRLIVFLEYSQT
jgi:hypothetical protein